MSTPITTMFTAVSTGKHDANGMALFDIFQGNQCVLAAVAANRVSFNKVTSHGVNGAVHHVAGPCIISVRYNGMLIEAQVV